MPGPVKLLIAIADGEHARFVQPDEYNAPHTISSIDSVSAHLRSRDIGSDRPGRSFESAAPAHHAVGQRHDLHAMEKVKFAQLVADEINARMVGYDELLVVAPPRALGEVCEGLDAATAAKLLGTLEKDLVKTPDHELPPHLREWLSPPRRPGR